MNEMLAFVGVGIPGLFTYLLADSAKLVVFH